ncbi:melanoma cell adhesion molecule b isoform X1 [Denticeps clupeoides]|nr:cell surface glycoprotein MUC18-like isoform X1 [Denticeps clupeoides]
MSPRGLLLAGLCTFLLLKPGIGQLQVSMEDQVNVFLGHFAEIPCMFSKPVDPHSVIIQWFSKAPGDSSPKQRIFYKDHTTSFTEKDTIQADRISMFDLGSGGMALTIKNVGLQDELDFICQVDSMSDGRAEGITRISVFHKPEFPTIKSETTGIHIINEEPSKIATCEVKNGYPTPNITWYRNGIPLQDSPGEVSVDIRQTKESSGLVSVDSTLKLKVMKEDKDAMFYCEVSYSTPGETRMVESPHIKITVHYPATFVEVLKESPKGQVKEGDTVYIRCNHDGNPAPEITFYHNNEELTNTLVVDNRLELHNVTRSQSGTYKCTIFDLTSYDENEDEMEIYVNFLDPAVVLPISPHIVSEGENMKATCNALSSLSTHTVWMKDGEQLLEGHVLNLSNISRDDAGEYICLVTTPSLDGLETQGSLSINVQGPPKITVSWQNYAKDYVTLNCLVQSYPKSVMTWILPNGQKLQSNETEMGDDTVSMVTLRRDASLSVSCQAENEFGIDNATLTIESETTSADPTTEPFTFTTSPLSTSAISKTTVSVPVTSTPSRRFQKGGSGVIVAVLIVCVLLLAILGSVLYFLYKKGKMPCGRSGKQDLTKKSNKDAIVMEMNCEEAVLLQGVNGDKKTPNNQYTDVQL